MISNSIKFTRDGLITITLADFDSDTIIIEVKDNGSGIAKEKYYI